MRSRSERLDVYKRQVWHGDEIRYTLSDGTGHSEAYSMYVVPLYD